MARAPATTGGRPAPGRSFLSAQLGDEAMCDVYLVHFDRTYRRASLHGCLPSPVVTPLNAHRSSSLSGWSEPRLGLQNRPYANRRKRIPVLSAEKSVVQVLLANSQETLRRLAKQNSRCNRREIQLKSEHFATGKAAHDALEVTGSSPVSPIAVSHAERETSVPPSTGTTPMSPRATLCDAARP